MQIQFPTNLPTTVVARLAAALPWSVNDLLVAEVVGKTDENFTRLSINGRIVVARTDAMLEVGQRLNLKVTSTCDATVMKVLPDAPPAEANTVSRAMARVLPQQATPQDTERLLRSLDALAQDTRVLPESVGRGAAEPGAAGEVPAFPPPSGDRFLLPGCSASEEDGFPVALRSASVGV